MTALAVGPVSPEPGKDSTEARRIAGHLSALDRWIAMLMAQGVNHADDGLAALARRREGLAQQLGRNGTTS